MEQLLLVCVMWIFVNGSTASFTLTATPQPVVEGSSVELECTSDTDLISGNNIIWRKGSQTVATVQQATTCTMSTDSSTNYTYRCDPPRVFYLTIPAVTSSEHNEQWSCQDLFGFGDTSITLDVIVPVPSVTMLSPASDPVVVSLGTSQTFTCQTGGSRPLGRIEWYKDGQNVTVQNGTVTPNGDLYITTSSLTLPGTKDNRLVTVQCKATNGYNTVPIESGTKTFVVQWPPDGQPSMSGNNQNVWYPNDVVTLQCRQMGGNPLATLTWGGLCGGIPSTDRSSDIEAVTEIQITINSSYNQQSCVCQSTHLQAATTQVSTIFTVHYSPLPSQVPTITGYTTGQILYEGDATITIQCRQAGGFPLSVLTWNCFGLVGINRTQTEAVSEIQLAPNRTYNGRTCTSTATHPDSRVGYSRSVTVTVTVYYAPLSSQVPTITGYITGQILYEGDLTIIVQCRQAGGFPLSVLTWTCFGLVGINRTQTDAVSEIQLTPNRTYNGRTCTCTATHPDSRVGYSRSVTVTLTVYHPPSVPTVTQTPTTAWLEGQTGTLTCNYGVGYPTDTTVTWLEDGSPIQTSTDDLVFGNITKDHDGQTYRCRVSNVFTQNRQPDLSSSGLSLNVEYYPRLTLSDSSVVITEGQTVGVICTAVGNPRPTVEWLQGGNRVTTGNTGTGTITVSNGDLTIENVDRSATGNFICRAKGNSSVPGRNLVTENVISLLVQYPPDVRIDVTNSTEGATVTLKCIGHGEPNLVTYVGWTQYIHNTLIRSDGDFPGISSDRQTITFDALSFRDAGIYRCGASNSIKDRQGNDIQRTETYFDVKAAAKFNTSHRRHEFYTEIGEQLEIKIPFNSNPKVGSISDIKWKHNNMRVSATQNISFKLISPSIISLDVYGKTIQYTGQTAVMNISSFLLGHAGNYSITVHNDGDSLESTSWFWIYLSDVPTSPEAFEVVTTTSSSITVAWTKGFNGGHMQTFVILYRRHGSYTTWSQEYTEKPDVTLYWATIGNLDPGTEYDFNIYSYNEQGNSTSIGKSAFTAVKQEALNAPEANQKDTSTGLFVGGAVMLIMAILFFIISIVLCKRYSIIERLRQQNNKKENPNGAASGELNTLSNYEPLQARTPPALYEDTNPQANSADYENSDPNSRSNYEALEPHRDIHLYDTTAERGRDVLYENTKSENK